MLNFWDYQSIGQLCEREYNWTYACPIKHQDVKSFNFCVGTIPLSGLLVKTFSSIRTHESWWPSPYWHPDVLPTAAVMAASWLLNLLYPQSHPFFHNLPRLAAAQHPQQYLDKLPPSHMFIQKDTVPWCSSSLCCSPEWLRPPLLWDNATISPLGRLRAPLEWHPRGAPKGPLLAQSSVCNTQALLFSLQWALLTPSANLDLSSHRVAHEGKHPQI